jgi:phosphoribosylaminoimidazole-succinocarboxamide synthase
MTDTLLESQLKGLKLLHRGKVRDTYAVDDRHLLIVTSDRISAFDVVMPTPIPGKGRILNAMSAFWFARTKAIIPNHLTEKTVADVAPDAGDRAALEGRAVVVKKLRGLPVEAIVRGYLVGSGWKDYQKTGSVCGIALPKGLREAEQLPEPIFTPSTKAALGAHDENISYDQMETILGSDMAACVRNATLAVYRECAAYARTRGIIIADTKLEFGVDEDGTLTLMDEVLTPDSSRFWPADQYRVGQNPPSFDKQYLRDWLEQSGWNKQAPAPDLPPEVVAKTQEKYAEALRRLTG